MAGPENAKKYKTGIFLAGSASAEFFADIGLCPFEAVKVRGAVPAYSREAAFHGAATLHSALCELWWMAM